MSGVELIIKWEKCKFNVDHEKRTITLELTYDKSVKNPNGFHCTLLMSDYLIAAFQRNGENPMEIFRRLMVSKEVSHELKEVIGKDLHEVSEDESDS